MSRSKHYDIVSDFFIFHHQVPRPLEVADIFGREAPLDVEIGFGLGDFLVSAAQNAPQRNFIGIELEPMCVYRTLHKIALINQSVGPGDRINNIRLLQVPVEVAFERFFNQRSIDKVYSLFPCPWPKKKHAKHRTFSRDFLRLVNSRLVTGGGLKIVTDYAPYFDWIKEQAQRTGFAFEEKRINAKYKTKYERKWQEGGQKKFHEILFKKERHVPVALKEDFAVKNHIVPQIDPKQFCFKDSTGPIAIVLKDFIFDAKKKKGMAHLVVSEKNLSQHVWAMISRHVRGFKVSLAPGNAVLPTEAVAQALSDVAKAARLSARSKKGIAKKEK